MRSVDNQPDGWLVDGVKSIGIFEAKTHFPSLCEQVASQRQPVLVRRRGQPMVVISPAGPEFDQERPDILTAWQEWKAAEKKGDPEFPEVWKMRSGSKADPLAD